MSIEIFLAALVDFAIGMLFGMLLSKAAYMRLRDHYEARIITLARCHDNEVSFLKAKHEQRELALKKHMEDIQNDLARAREELSTVHRVDQPSISINTDRSEEEIVADVLREQRIILGKDELTIYRHNRIQEPGHVWASPPPYGDEKQEERGTLYISSEDEDQE